MKNYLKFVVAVFGMTIAIFGSITIAKAKVAANIGGTCSGSYYCGTANNGSPIDGTFHEGNEPTH